MNKAQREVKEILKHSVLWTLYFVAILAVALVVIYTQVNSPLGAHILSHFCVIELGKDSSFRCVLFLELNQNMKL
ncbi:TPA: hypothetical protein I7160_22755 [Vibrio vulnificus]|nr:hypothetical protein [Vibrio vulnificus]HAS6186153.1 hypothetical protein [Vibrio vulnificus]HAT8547667.1 hypothetical protein [Vibrio vulnificus]